jgi:hypothetical protein
LGFLATGRNDEYAISLRGQGIDSIRFRRSVDPVPLEPAEWAEWDAIATFTENRGKSLGFDVTRVSIPRSKPYYYRLAVGRSGRVWVLRHAKAVKTEPVPHFGSPDRPPLTWVEPPTFDVFESDGTFRGPVVLPLNFDAHEFHGDKIWGVHTDNEGVERVVRLRIQGS